MKRILVASFLILIVLTLGWYLFYSNRTKLSSSSEKLAAAKEKVYIAVEEEGKIAVLNLENDVVKYISLDEQVNGMTVSFMAHNVQVAPDGKSVWVTGNVAGGHKHGFRMIPQAYAHGDEEEAPMDTSGDMHDIGSTTQDEAIVIDPETDNIIKRVPLGSGMHLAHVVLSPDSSYAYITAQEKDLLFKVNTLTFEVESKIELKKGSGPHGLRIAPDGKTAYLALSTGKAIGTVDLGTQKMTYIPLKGQGVQTGVTPDGKYVVVSVFDAKSMGVYDTTSKKLSYVALPEDAKGPLQMYATPDSRYVYLADQGNYFGQPDNNKVYKIDLNLQKVVFTITVGTAPHGVVVSKDGKRVYVTNLVSGDLSIIDTQRDTEMKRVKVGDHPNGVSIWSRETGGTP